MNEVRENMRIYEYIPVITMHEQRSNSQKNSKQCSSIPRQSWYYKLIP